MHMRAPHPTLEPLYPTLIPMPMMTLAQAQDTAITLAMRDRHGKLGEAAAILGLTRHSLSRRLVLRGWAFPRADVYDRSKFQIRPCENARCSKHRTWYARENWRCICGHWAGAWQPIEIYGRADGAPVYGRA